jgi:hypothetical protein
VKKSIKIVFFIHPYRILSTWPVAFPDKISNTKKRNFSGIMFDLKQETDHKAADRTQALLFWSHNKTRKQLCSYHLSNQAKDEQFVGLYGPETYLE